MILVKTELGNQVLKDRSVLPLTPRQRAAFIMIDGRRSVNDILQSSQAAGVTREDIEHLVQTGVAEQTGATLHAYAPTATMDLAAVPDGPSRTSLQERYAAAYPIASRLTSDLGLRGFRLNLAVEAARTYEELLAVGARIKEAVGEEKFEPLRRALKG
jgi:hypothetical protein